MIPAEVRSGSTLLDKVEPAGWDRGQAASALMYLAAKRLQPA
jgi:hypothetical protein